MFLNVLLLATFSTTIMVWVSFFLSSLILILITLYHLYFEKNYSPFISSYIVFTFLFFLAAPITQIDSFLGVNSPKFITNFPYRENLVIYTNVLISMFNIIFITSYIQFKKYLREHNYKSITPINQKLLPLTIFIITFLSILIFIFSFDFVLSEFSRPSWIKSKESVMVLLTWKKVLFMVPFGGVLLCFQYLKKRNKKISNHINIIIFLCILFILLFWFKNPFTEKRNALGPIYISLIYLLSPRLLNSNIKTVSFLFFSMIILFPLSAILTHSDATFLQVYNNPWILVEQMKGGGITEAFGTLNYDAFANTMATIDYVNKYGFSYGFQFLGSILFFIPRSIWVSKPLSTGKLVGEHLINDYGFGFDNLSNPLVSESFINFGIIGIILTAIFFAFILIRMMSWLQSDNYLKKIMAFYLAIHLIFLLRGDFTNGFSYFIGPLVGVILIPKSIEIFIKELLLFSKYDKVKKK